MSIGTLSHNSHLSQLAERQMRTWALQLEAQKRLEKERADKAMQQRIHPYLVLSRETGVNAGELAHAIAAKCGWKVLDRELLDYMAEHDHLSRFALEFVDEKVVSWFRETFGKWLDEQLVSQAQFVSRLGKLVLLAAQHESTVFVGRGVQFILPRENGVAVRIIAPESSASSAFGSKSNAASMRRKSSWITPTTIGLNLCDDTSCTMWPTHTSTTC